MPFHTNFLPLQLIFATKSKEFNPKKASKKTRLYIVFPLQLHNCFENYKRFSFEKYFYFFLCLVKLFWLSTTLLPFLTNVWTFIAIINLSHIKIIFRKNIFNFFLVFYLFFFSYASTNFYLTFVDIFKQNLNLESLSNLNLKKYKRI